MSGATGKKGEVFLSVFGLSLQADSGQWMGHWREQRTQASSQFPRGGPEKGFPPFAASVMVSSFPSLPSLQVAVLAGESYRDLFQSSPVL